MTTPPYDQWLKKEQAELEAGHSKHLAQLAAYQQFEKERTAIQERMHREHAAAMKAQADKTEQYREEHLASHKRYARTASSSRSTL